MITPEYVETLYDYHYWAIRRLLDAAGHLDPTDIDQVPLDGLGSLRQIFVHALSAEWIWSNRLRGVSPPAMLDPSELPTFATIRARWAEEQVALRAIIAELDQADLAEEITYRTTEGTVRSSPRWHILVHLANTARSTVARQPPCSRPSDIRRATST
jgi:uncharacterized damage-inducible protein DinB